MPLPTSDQIEKARLNKASRKLDTRRKNILGGLLIDAAGKDERYAKVVTALNSYRDTLQPVTWPSCVP